jgi:hypothetical protein
MSDVILGTFGITPDFQKTVLYGQSNVINFPHMLLCCSSEVRMEYNGMNMVFFLSENWTV